MVSAAHIRFDDQFGLISLQVLDRTLPFDRVFLRPAGCYQQEKSPYGKQYLLHGLYLFVVQH